MNVINDAKIKVYKKEYIHQTFYLLQVLWEMDLQMVLEESSMVIPLERDLTLICLLFCLGCLDYFLDF